MSQYDIFIYWLLSLFGSLVVVVGKIGMKLFGLDAGPPEDAVQAAHWKRKRLWLAISELMAVPAFATVGITTTVYLNLTPVTSVLISMVLGGLGFGFLLSAMAYFAKKKTGMEP